MYNNLNIGSGKARYQQVEKQLAKTNGIISQEDAMKLLEEVRIPDRTQWSIVYNQSNSKIELSMGENYNKLYNFEFKIKN